jgi:hypothetical protein
VFSKAVGDSLRMYLLTLDDKHLETARADIAREIKEGPSISSVAICLPGMGLMDVLAQMETQSVLSYSRAQYQPSSTSVPIYDLLKKDDLLRVFPVSFPVEGANIETVDFIIGRIVYVDRTNGQIVLAPEAIL